MTTRDIKRRRPLYATEIRQDAGEALRLTARQGKVRAQVYGLNKADESRQSNGHTDGVVGRFYGYVRSAVREARAGAGPLIAGAMMVAEEEALKLPAPEIRRRLLECLAQEVHAQAEGDRAQYRLVVALGENPADLREALEAYDAATRSETAAHAEALVYGRALRVARGWREGPEVRS
jgi:hypothetical protein